MFKKIIALIMSIALLFCLAGCDKKSEENKAEEYKSVITDLLDALALGDYDKVESLLYEKSDGEFQKICEKYEKTAGLYKKTVDLIDRRGAVGLFTARLIPVVRTFISIPAGLMKMRLRDYIPVSVVGNTVFVAINMVLGYFFTSFFV